MIYKYLQPERWYKGQKYSARWIFLRKEVIDLVHDIPGLIIYESYRTRSEQQKMVDTGRSRTLQSNHRRGVAIDVINWKEMQPILRSRGMINDISWDRNHYTLGGERKAARSFPILNIIRSQVREYKPRYKSNNAKPMTIQDARIMIEAYAQERVRSDAITDSKNPLHIDVEHWAQRYLNEPAKRAVFDGLNANIDDIMEKSGFTHYNVKNRSYEKTSAKGKDCKDQYELGVSEGMSRRNREIKDFKSKAQDLLKKL